METAEETTIDSPFKHVCAHTLRIWGWHLRTLQTPTREWGTGSFFKQKLQQPRAEESALWNALPAPAPKGSRHTHPLPSHLLWPASNTEENLKRSFVFSCSFLLKAPVQYLILKIWLLLLLKTIFSADPHGQVTNNPRATVNVQKGQRHNVCFRLALTGNSSLNGK